MWQKVAFALIVLCGIIAKISGDEPQKIVCYYDSRSYAKEGVGRVSLTDLEPALAQCTHLVYGYAGLNADTFKMVSLNEQQDLDVGKALYRETTALKKKFPGLKVLLSVGGDADAAPEKYLALLESTTHRMAFINSAYALLKSYSFDGLDLAFEFPKIKPKKIRSTAGSIWSSFKKKIGVGGNPVDEKSDEHKEEFTSLVRELKNSFRHDGFQLALTVLPSVNASLYLDVPAIINYVDFITLAAFDVQTPDRNPKEADHPAPLYPMSERNPELNVDFQVTDLLRKTAPSVKIVVGIPTYGRAWKLEKDVTATGVPPVTADGPAEAGLQSTTPGLLGYAEICAKLPNPSNKDFKGAAAPYRKVGDPTKRFGSFAYRTANDDNENGIWVGYEDTDSAGSKAAYVKAKSLGGVAIFDLSLDDFAGACTTDKFPILRSARYRLL
jgi:chitinase